MAQATRPGNPDRGWNDPPMLLHTSPHGGPPVGPAPTTSKRTLLNKRVAHPGITGPVPTPPGTSTAQSSPPRDGSSDVSGTSPVANVVVLPPKMSTTISKGIAPIIIPNMAPVQANTVQGPGSPEVLDSDLACSGSPKDELEIPDVSDDQQLLHYIKSQLLRVLNDCESALGARVKEDVRKKLQIFESMWENGKISYPVKAAMARLATALHKRKCDIAHEIHLGLMMDYVSEVGQWMVGIKRLIQEARLVGAPLSPNTADQQNHSPNLNSAHPVTEGTESQNSVASHNTQQDSKEDNNKDVTFTEPQISEQPSGESNEGRNLIPAELPNVPNSGEKAADDVTQIIADDEDVAKHAEDVKQSDTKEPDAGQDKEGRSFAVKDGGVIHNQHEHEETNGEERKDNNNCMSSIEPEGSEVNITKEDTGGSGSENVPTSGDAGNGEPTTTDKESGGQGNENNKGTNVQVEAVNIAVPQES